MRRLLITVFFILYILHGNLYSQDLIRERAEFLTDSILKARGEAYIAIPNTRLKAFRQLPAKLILDKYSDSLSYFYLNQLSYLQLKETGIEFYYVVPPSLRGPVHMAKSVGEVFDGSAYPTYQQYLAVMDSFRSKYPSICRIDTIGYSKNGKLILAARLHSGNYLPGDKPVLMYSSTIHGDEPLGYVLMLRLLDDLLKNYRLNEEYTALVDEAVILINPLSNPDGTYFTSDTSVYGSIRQNLNYKDLNRDFPERIFEDDPVNFNWQPENFAMAQYLWKYKPSLSANFHGGAEVVNYPWDAIPEKHPDDQWFRYISKEYADTAKKVDPAYMDEFTDGITNGYAWYYVPGGRMDYVTYYLKGREVTIELSNVKIPPASNLAFFWLVNRRSLINYLKQGLYGIWGTVSDAQTEIPLRAKIEIPGHDKLNSFINSDILTGKFFRYVYEGNYDFNVGSDGYLTQNITGVHALNHQRTEISIRLTTPQSLLKEQAVLIFPNPFTNNFTLLFETEIQSDCDLRIYDSRGILVHTSVFISKPGINLTEIDLSGNRPGIYTIKLVTGNKLIRKKIVKAG